MDLIVGLSLITAGIVVLARAARRKPEIIGRNEAVKRMLRK